MNKILTYIFWVIIPFSITGQNLTIEETVKYINEKIKNNPSPYYSDGFTGSISISKDRLFFHYTKHKISLSVYEVDLSQLELEVDYPNSKIKIPCDSYDGENCDYDLFYPKTPEIKKKQEEYCIISEKLDRSSKFSSSRRDFCIVINFSNGEEIGNNLLNAIDYLIKKVKKTYKPKKDDPTDPFNEKIPDQEIIADQFIKEKSTNQNAENRNNEKTQGIINLNPHLGITTNYVNFRASPNMNSEIISKLPKNRSIYLFSLETINSYYKAIDITTNNIGWIHKNYILIDEKIEIDKSGTFKEKEYTSNTNTVLQIENSSKYKISLVFGDSIYLLPPNSKRQIEAAPGAYYYVASAPGVIPSNGFQSFKGNHKYEWLFYIESIRK